jgi:hypothetical protein
MQYLYFNEIVRHSSWDRNNIRAFPLSPVVPSKKMKSALFFLVAALLSMAGNVQAKNHHADRHLHVNQHHMDHQLYKRVAKEAAGARR